MIDEKVADGQEEIQEPEIDETDQLISEIDDYDKLSVNEKGELVLEKSDQEDSGDDTGEDVDTPSGEPEDTPDEPSDGDSQDTPEAAPDPLEKLYKKIEALEKRLGGEDKPDGKEKTQSDVIKETDTDDLLDQIKVLEEKIEKPDASLEDEEFGRNTVLLNKLTREYNSRMTSGRFDKERATEENAKVLDSFKEKYSDMPDDEIKSYFSEAVDLFGGKAGIVKESDIEAVLVRKDPGKFKKYLQLSAVSQERERIAKAKEGDQPRASAAGTGTGARNLSLGELAKRNPQKFRKVLKRMSNSELAKVKL